MHKKASLCEPARQSGCVLMLPVAAKRRVGCQKRHSLESARPLIPSCSISVELRAARAPMNLADQLKGNACGLSPAALPPWRSSGGFGHRIDSFGRSAPNFAAAFRSATKLSARFPSPAAGVRWTFCDEIASRRRARSAARVHPASSSSCAHRARRRTRAAPLRTERPCASSLATSWVEQRHLRSMELAAKPQAHPSWLPSAALHPWRSPGGFGHHIDSFGCSAPNFAAAFRSATKLSARFPSPAAGV